MRLFFGEAVSYRFAQLIFASVEGEDAIWMSLLVLVIVAAGWGLYSVVKTRVGGFGGENVYYSGRRGYSGRFERLKGVIGGYKERLLGGLAESVRAKAAGAKAGLDASAGGAREEKKRLRPAKVSRDLAGGMELLGDGFLVGVIEDVGGRDVRDVSMRRMSFEELVRRGRLAGLSGEALKAYAVDKEHLYGKTIQCEALEELARRTRSGGPGERGRRSIGEREHNIGL